jgi:hypothetical protein
MISKHADAAGIVWANAAKRVSNRSLMRSMTLPMSVVIWSKSATTTRLTDGVGWHAETCPAVTPSAGDLTAVQSTAVDGEDPDGRQSHEWAGMLAGVDGR